MDLDKRSRERFELIGFVKSPNDHFSTTDTKDYFARSEAEGKLDFISITYVYKKE